MTAVVLIHGFSGGPESWGQVRGTLDVPSLAPAVRGHGGDPDPGATTRNRGGFEAEVDRLAAIARTASPPRCVAGYSLGGRLALGLLARYPDLFAAAMLIGANPGIEDRERPARRAADEKWARLIESEGLAEFDRRWSALPLFASQGGLEAERIEEQRRIRLSHDPAGLAAAMRALSLAAMPDYRSALPAIACPVELVVGGLDEKFSALARKMAGGLPAGSVRVVEGVGHNAILEAPAAVAELLQAIVRRLA